VRKGFTLIELLVVVAIIGILAAVGTPIFQGFIIDAKITATQENHIRIRDFITASFTRCTSGAEYIPMITSSKGSLTNISCDKNTYYLGMYLAGHLSYIMKNPYGDPYSAVDSVYSATTVPRLGGTQIFAYGGSSCSHNNRHPKYSYTGCNMMRIATNIGDKDGNNKVIVSVAIKE